LYTFKVAAKINVFAATKIVFIDFIASFFDKPLIPQWVIAKFCKSCGKTEFI
jgi:hypothetical protein